MPFPIFRRVPVVWFDIELQVNFAIGCALSNRINQFVKRINLRVINDEVAKIFHGDFVFGDFVFIDLGFAVSFLISS